MVRPKEFDQDEALERAMQVFWKKGYDGTSVQDLVDEMGINRGSLYNTFGDKHTLFLAAIDKYCAQIIGDWFTELRRPDAGLDTIRVFFNGLVHQATGDQGWRGCLMTNTVIEMAPHDDVVAARVAANLKRIETTFHTVLERAQTQGELNPGKDPRALARFLTGHAQGLLVLCKASPSKAVLEDAASVALSVLD